MKVFAIFTVNWLLILAFMQSKNLADAAADANCGEPRALLLKIAKKFTWPWMASIGIDMNFSDKRQGTWRAGNCDAVLINEEWAITNSDCLRDVVVRFGHNPLKKRWTVRSGSHERVFKLRNRREFRKSRAVFYVHQQVSGTKTTVALVQMKKKIGLGTGIQPVCLPFKKTSEDVVCNVIGYSNLVSPSTIPQNCSVCKSKHQEFDCNKEICVEYENTIFKGLSGGILVCQAMKADMYTWYVAGIGQFDAAGKRFVKVEPLLPWINSSILTHSRNKIKDQKRME